jgi:hypothetical protein
MAKFITVMVLAVVVTGCGDGAGTTANSEQAQASATAAPATAESAAGGSGSSAAPAPAPTYREVTLPAGTTLRLELESTVASDTSHVDDAVRAKLRQPVVVDGETVIPAGGEVAGTVTSAVRSGRVQGRARIAYRFDSIRVDGERYEISTAPVSHVAPATKRKDATKIGIGAGAGALVGAIVGGGDGAAKGAALGGAGGTGVVLATRGDEVRVGPGADVNAKLTAPLKVRVRVG